MKAGIWAAIAVLTTAVLLSILPVRGEEHIYEGVIRLHVVAVSDDAIDQHRKLAVRDSILAVVSPQMQEAADVAEAETMLRDMLPLVEQTARDKLRQMGDSHTVTVQLTKERYPTRLYDNFAMPAGEYLSLQVILGNGEGQNWWCVLFPTVCGKFASGDEKVWQEAGFTPEEYRMITGEGVEYQIRFRFLEIWEALRTRFRTVS